MIAALARGGLAPEYAVGPPTAERSPGVSPPTPTLASTRARRRSARARRSPRRGRSWGGDLRAPAPDAAGRALPPVVGGRYRPVLGDAPEHGRLQRADVARRTATSSGTSSGRRGWTARSGCCTTRTPRPGCCPASSWRAFAKQDPVYEEIGRWLGHGLLTAEGEEWTRQKRFVQPLFTKPAVDGYADLMVDEIERVVADRDDTGTESSTSAVDAGAHPARRRCGRCSVSPPTRSWATCGAPSRSSPTPSSVGASASCGSRRRSRPRASGAGELPRPTCSASATPSSPPAAPAAPTAAPTCSAGSSRRATATSCSSDDEVRDQVLVFLLAGHETTATALTFALHLLGRHPDVQDAVRAEVREVVGDGTPHGRGDGIAPADDGGPRGDDAALPVGAVHPPPRGRGRRGHGPPVPPAPRWSSVRGSIHRHPRLLGRTRSPSTRRGSRRGRGRGAPPPVRVDAVRRRPARLHRPALLDGRGDARPRRRCCGTTA